MSLPPYCMRTCKPGDVLVSGVGVTSAIGQGREDFLSALFEGRHAFGVLKRTGRQEGDTCFIGAEIEALQTLPGVDEQRMRGMSFSAEVALATLTEAWQDAALDQVDPERISLVVGGSNFQQRFLATSMPGSARPSYALHFMDTDLSGVCSEHFGIRGGVHTIGAASASGQLAVIQAAQAIVLGGVDAAIALGPVMDLSHRECRAFRSLGAMGSDRFADAPDQACRPFDLARDGFIFGEACAVVVLESEESAARRSVRPYGRLRGWSARSDGNRNPNPSLDGEMRVIREALANAEVPARSINYINPHGSGSVLGDRIELEALAGCGLSHAPINATKALTGHGLASAGIVEIVATLLQMRAERLHPTRNLERPLNASFAWVGQHSVAHRISHALSLSFGFGGINTALCLGQP
ncbi:beta-ketoacyl synthase N-terminal-like domain-containing protein [Chromobacterium sp. IIBBL 290-4]|uniref:beta-ketoacyl synthase N-terminal-like domain-containing protein n=1 Tax=Chromobacterium sp. IIBBL 290-4 TaxID=2953890 RepID=UPI0020B84956|nr:beta-ketoacyl synthase N-terminal-like domain-containing protein [Chromobacterium sp. IIBBL 290-4]UTH76442.1 polyketide beta-ketoacyl:ACP synthase [Chromobacterium sp. IIBBL 290-4]